jgi:hypothetical protein
VLRSFCDGATFHLAPIFALALPLLAPDTDDDATPNPVINDQKRDELTELVPRAAYGDPSVLARTATHTTDDDTPHSSTRPQRTVSVRQWTEVQEMLRWPRWWKRANSQGLQGGRPALPRGRRRNRLRGSRKIVRALFQSRSVWEFESGRKLRTLEGHAGPVDAVAVTPDGRRAVSTSYDRTVKVWRSRAAANRNRGH